MEPWPFRVFISALTLQLAMAILVYFDAHRLNLKYPPLYLSITLTPVIGLVIGVAYAYGRRSLPRWSEDEPAASTEDRTRMRTEIAYFVGIVVCLGIAGVIRSMVGS